MDQVKEGNNPTEDGETGIQNPARREALDVVKEEAEGEGKTGKDDQSKVL